MIMLITGNFPLYDREDIPTGKTEFVVSHGVDLDTGIPMVLPNEPPSSFPGAFFSPEVNEWLMPGE